MEKGYSFPQEVLTKLGIYMQKKNKTMNLHTDLTMFTKINSKSIIDLNVKCKTMKVLEEKIIENLSDLGFGNTILATTPKAQSNEEK